MGLDGGKPTMTTNARPATPAQLNFLGLLAKELGLPVPTVIGKADASEKIDQFLKAKKSIAPAAKQVEVPPGYYVTGAGETAVVHKVMWNKAHSHQYVKVLTENYGDQDWTWEYAPGTLGKLAELLAANDAAPLTLEVAKELGHVWGRCIICGRKLTVPESVVAGIGPVCAKKL